MINTNITKFRQNIFEYINQAVEFNGVINVNTKNGNAIILSESEYNSLVETLYLTSNSRVKKEILEGKEATLKDCVPADEVEW